jgi:DNA-binding NarL/FixJ family response regulator
VTLRVVIAEDNKVYREGVRAVLEFGGEFEVVAVADRPDALLEQVDELQPDAVITDIRMPPTHHMEGIEAAHEIRRRHPQIGILVLSQHADDSYAFELLKDGTAGFGYLLKERIGDDDGAIARAVKEVVSGRSVIDPEVVDGLVSRQTRAKSSPLHRLTDREREVLGLMAQGKTNEAIAESLHLHRATVEKHINAIFSALDLAEEKQVNKRVAAVLLFLRDA